METPDPSGLQWRRLEVKGECCRGSLLTNLLQTFFGHVSGTFIGGIWKIQERLQEFVVDQTAEKLSVAMSGK